MGFLKSFSHHWRPVVGALAALATLAGGSMAFAATGGTAPDKPAPTPAPKSFSVSLGISDNVQKGMTDLPSDTQAVSATPSIKVNGSWSGSHNLITTLQYEGGTDVDNNNSQVQPDSKQKSQEVTDPTKIEAQSFAPSDFGWHHWYAGDYTFTVSMLAGGQLESAPDSASAKWSVAQATYTLTASTQQQSSKDMTDLNSSPVSDKVTLAFGNNSYKVSEDLVGQSTLSYKAKDGSQKAASHEVDFKSTDTTFAAPAFSPSELGMKTWQPGSYLFSFHADKQGRLANAIDAPATNEGFNVRLAQYGLVASDRAVAQPMSDLDSAAVYDSVSLKRSGDPVPETVHGTVTLTGPLGTVSKDLVFDTRNFEGNTYTASEPQFTPQDFNGAQTWKAGTYRFSVNIPKDARMAGASTALGTFSVRLAQYVPSFRMSGMSSPRAQDNNPVTFTVTGRRKDGDAVSEDVPAKLTVSYGKSTYGYNKPVTFTKDVTLKNDDSVNLAISPAEFGWNAKQGWQEGSYTVNLTVPQTARMSAAPSVDGGTQSMGVNWVAPASVTKKVDQTTVVNGMAATTRVSTGTGRGGFELAFHDVIDPKGQAVHIASPKVEDTTSNSDVTRDFAILVDQKKHSVDATYKRASGILPADHTLVLSFDTTVSDPQDGSVTDQAAVTWNRHGMNTNGAAFSTARPAPGSAWTITGGSLVPAKKARRVLVEGDPVVATTTGKVPAGLTRNMTGFVLVSNHAKADPAVDLSDPAKAKVLADGKDVTSEFAITVKDGQTIATASPAFLGGTRGLKAAEIVELVQQGTVKAAPQGSEPEAVLTGSEAWNGQSEVSKADSVFTWSPAATDGWKTTDGRKADNLLFRDGERLVRETSLTLPAYLAKAPEVTLTASLPATGLLKADYSKASVLENGADVTGKFTMKQTGNSLTAAANPDMAVLLAGSDKPITLTLQVPVAVAAPAAATRKAYNVTPDQKLDTRETADGKALAASGAAAVNSAKATAGSQAVGIHIPATPKAVLTLESEGGDGTSANNLHIRAGQSLGFKLDVDDSPAAGMSLAYTGGSATITDTPSPKGDITIDPASVEVTDAEGEIKVEPQVQGGVLTLSVPAGRHLVVTYSATANKDVKAGTLLTNTYTYNAVPGGQTSNTVSDADAAASESTTSGITVAGKTLLLGDTVDYKVALDTTGLASQAYRTHRIGIIDSIDTKHLAVDPAAIRLVDQNGKDVTGLLTVAVVPDKDNAGRSFVYAFLTPQKGLGTRSLADYATGDVDLEDSVDPAELGQKYTLTIPATVVRTDENAEITNSARLVIDADSKDLKVEAVTLPRLDPASDVVINVGEASAAGKTIYKGHWFLYAMKSGTLPQHMAYPVSRWALADSLDPAHDQWTGNWAVYSKGAKLDSSAAPTGLFTASQSGNVITVAMTKAGLARATQLGNWTAYLQMRRTAPGAKVWNSFTELLNAGAQKSVPVWTTTPDMTPDITVTKFDSAEGPVKGDRNTPREALVGAKNGTRITVRVTNRSAAAVHHLSLSDKTVAGNGHVVWDGASLANLARTTLTQGQSVDVTGTLQGIRTYHTDRATVRAVPVVPNTAKDAGEGGDTATLVDGTPITAHDDWNSMTVTYAREAGRNARGGNRRGLSGLAGRRGRLAATGVAVASIGLAGLVMLAGAALAKRRRA